MCNRPCSIVELLVHIDRVFDDDACTRGYHLAQHVYTYAACVSCYSSSYICILPSHAFVVYFSMTNVDAACEVDNSAGYTITITITTTIIIINHQLSVINQSSSILSIVIYYTHKTRVIVVGWQHYAILCSTLACICVCYRQTDKRINRQLGPLYYSCWQVKRAHRRKRINPCLFLSYSTFDTLLLFCLKCMTCNVCMYICIRSTQLASSFIMSSSHSENFTNCKNITMFVMFKHTRSSSPANWAIMIRLFVNTVLHAGSLMIII
jgi:hypothetical protein